MRESVNAAIVAGEEPRAPTRGPGLILRIPGGKARRLIETNGHLTPAGAHFYERTAREPPTAGIDPTAAPTRQGARLLIKLLNGKTSAVRTWDGVQRRWRFTRLGLKYYAESQDSYVVTFPVHAVLIRTNASQFEDNTVLKSTATSLGEIRLKTLMPDAEQLAEVKRLTEEYLAGLPVDDEGRKILIEGGGSQTTMTLDPNRQLEYNREEILIQPDGSLTVSAVLHRPLRAGMPWCFGLRGVCPEAFDETDDGCVPHQLAALLQRTSPGLREGDLDHCFDEIYGGLYGADSEENPYLLERDDGSVERRCWRTAGVTAAMIIRFAEIHYMAAHVLWGGDQDSFICPRRRHNVRVSVDQKRSCLFCARSPDQGGHCKNADDEAKDET